MWFDGLSDERILEVLEQGLNVAVVLMQDGDKKESIKQYDSVEKIANELKEYVSQINDIRSPLYNQRREFIYTINSLLNTTYEKMVNIFQQQEKQQ